MLNNIIGILLFAGPFLIFCLWWLVRYELIQDIQDNKGTKILKNKKRNKSVNKSGNLIRSFLLLDYIKYADRVMYSFFIFCIIFGIVFYFALAVITIGGWSELASNICSILFIVYLVLCYIGGSLYEIKRKF